MTFLAVVIALVLFQLRGGADRLQRDDWFRRWQGNVLRWSIGPPGRLALVILVPVVLAQFILDALLSPLFGLLWIALAVILLLYSLGRKDVRQQMAQYQSQCRSGDFEGAYLDTLSDRKDEAMLEDPASPHELHALVQRRFFYDGYQRWFPVLFYFVLLGPTGALAYRLVQLARDDFEPGLTARCVFLLDWVPARVLAVTFSLTGSFVSSRDVLLEGLMDWAAPASQLLYNVGTAALEPPPLPTSHESSFGETAAAQNEQVGKLLSRSAICWVALASLIVLLD